MTRTPDRILDELLVIRSQSGDARAFASLVDRWQERLRRHVVRLTGRRDAAADVLQESWLTVVRGIGRLEDPARFPAWVYRITSRRAVDWLRRESRHGGAASGMETGNGPVAERPAEAGTTESISRTRTAIRALPRVSRVILTLHYIEELSVLDIAGALGIPAGTVKSRLHHARARLERLLEEDES